MDDHKLPLSRPTGQAQLAPRAVRTFSRLRLKQDNNRFFNPKFDHRNLRANLITQILDPMVARVGFQKSTLFLAVSLMDACLSKHAFDAELVPTVGIVALSLASKFNEISFIGLGEAFFVEMGDCVCPDHFGQIEKLMLESVDFNVNVVSPFDFVRLFLDLGCLFDQSELAMVPDLDALESALYQLVLLTSSEYGTNQFRPLNVALSVVMILRANLGAKYALTGSMCELVGLSHGQCRTGSCYEFCSGLVLGDSRKLDEISRFSRKKQKSKFGLV